ncbi:MAG: hypothetical protein KDA24_14395 [Deltaproteobacteria bacterium]|nr:hypothetical protein [Deltaproteobacteria bacterium]
MSPRHALLLMALTPSLALAYPSTDRGALDGGASTSDLAVSDDGRYIAASQRSDGAGLAIWDRIAPSALPALPDVCEATSVVWTSHSSRGDAFYVGCGKNEVVRIDLDDTTVPPGVTVGTPIVVGGKTESVVALGWTSTDLELHVLTSGDSLARLHSINILTDAVDAGTGLPATGSGAAADLVVVPLTQNNNIIGIQSNGALLWSSRVGTSYTAQEAQFLSGTPTGLALDPEGTDDRFLAAYASTGEVWSGGVDTVAGAPTLWADGLNAPQAIAYGQGLTTSVVYIANASSELTVYDLDANELEVIPLGSTGSPVAIAPAPDDMDTVYVAGGDGTIRVVSARPWVSELAVTPDSVTEGDTFTISFVSDTDCEWDVRIDSELDSSAGTSVASGSSTAEGEVSVTLDSSVLAREGANRLVVFAENDEGATGVDSIEVTLDTPPEGILDFVLEPGDARLVASWTASEEVDIASYRIYLSDAPFTADDEELPELTLETEDGEVDYPFDIDAGDPSTGHSIEIEGTINGSLYYVAIQGIDEGGAEGPLSAVLAAAPESTCGLVECYGDPGCTCSSASSQPRGVSVALLGLAALGLRRRRSTR